MTAIGGNYYYDPAIVNHGPYSLMGTLYLDSNGDDRLALNMGKRSSTYDAKKHCIRLDKNAKDFLIVSKETDISVAKALETHNPNSEFVPYEPLTRFFAEVQKTGFFDKGSLQKFVQKLSNVVDKVNIERAAKIKL